MRCFTAKTEVVPSLFFFRISRILFALSRRCMQQLRVPDCKQVLDRDGDGDSDRNDEQIEWRTHKKRYDRRFRDKANALIADRYDKEEFWLDNDLRSSLTSCAKTIDRIEKFLRCRDRSNIIHWRSEIGTACELVERHGKEQYFRIDPNDYSIFSPVFMHYWNLAIERYRESSDRPEDKECYIVKTCNPADDGKTPRFFLLHSIHVLRPYLVRRLSRFVQVADFNAMMNELVSCVPLVESTNLQDDLYRFCYKYRNLATKRAMRSVTTRLALRSVSYARHQKNEHRAEKQKKRTEHRRELADIVKTQLSSE